MSVSALDRGVVDELRSIVGPAAVIADPERLLAYESDALVAYRHRPSAVVLPADTGEAADVIRLLHRAKARIVPRGAGTGLSGGALALDGAVAVGTARMNRILSLETEARVARVQAGVVNAHLSVATAPHGLLYAPDPSSQSTCTLGGNVAENSGGPHCLKYGVTSRYVRGLTLVLPDGEVTELGGAFTERRGYDLVGLVVGSEGCFGLVTEIEVALMPLPEEARTLLAIFDTPEDAGRAVTEIIGSGLLPAALEIIDGETIRAVEASVFAAGYPLDAGAALVVEFDGTGAGLDPDASSAEACCKRHGAREVRRAKSEEERAALWKGRKKAFGAMGRIAPDLLVQDATVPRSRLPEVLEAVGRIATRHDLTVANVFHAGDGNLHPNILFDRRDPAQVETVERASREIMRVCVEAGGTITGEHGVGIDKKAYMPLVCGSDELEAMAAVKEAFDPTGRFNPDKVLPSGTRPFRGDGGTRDGSAGRVGAPDPARLAESVLGVGATEEVADGGATRVVARPRTVAEAAALLQASSAAGIRVLPVGRRTQAAWDVAGPADLLLSSGALAPSLQHEPADLTVSVSAGTGVSELAARVGEGDQWLPIDPPGAAERSIGGIVSCGASGPSSARYGEVRDLVLGAELVTGDGRILRLGGRVVKNVAGFDLVRLTVGSRGTLGLITSVQLRLYPLPKASKTLVAHAARIEDLVDAAHRVATAPIVPGFVRVVERTEPDGVPRAVLKVSLHGSAPAVEAEAAIARRRVPALTEENGDGGMWGLRYAPGSIGLLLRRSPVRMARSVADVRELLNEARRESAADDPVIELDPVSGRLRVRFRPVWSGQDPAERWRARVRRLTEELRADDGGLAVEACPRELVAGLLDVADDPSPRGRLVRRLRECFDPAGILAAKGIGS